MSSGATLRTVTAAMRALASSMASAAPGEPASKSGVPFGPDEPEGLAPLLKSFRARLMAESCTDAVSLRGVADQRRRRVVERWRPAQPVVGLRPDAERRGRGPQDHDERLADLAGHGEALHPLWRGGGPKRRRRGVAAGPRDPHPRPREPELTMRRRDRRGEGGLAVWASLGVSSASPSASTGAGASTLVFGRGGGCRTRVVVRPCGSDQRRCGDAAPVWQQEPDCTWRFMRCDQMPRIDDVESP
jgi:hypothetical protein